jgi:VWFA-related protein
VRRIIQIGLLLSLTLPNLAQIAAQTPSIEPEQLTLSATSRLVIVPTLVQSRSGALVTNLHTEDFHLTDNGVEQTLLAEQLDRQSLAIAVLMQTGGAAPRQFQNYRTFNILLNALLNTTPDAKIARAPHKVALVTFDSRLREIWNFPPRVDGLKHAFTHPEGGDSGAAILDALNCGLALLEQQPASYRRILVLLSQSKDEHSQIPAEDLIRRLAASNTTVYSISFTHQPAKPHALPATLEEAAKAMRENPATEAAVLSGGEHSALNREDELEHALSILATDFANTYMLSFHPTAPRTSSQNGLHTLQVRLASKSSRHKVKARTLYWLSPSANQGAGN